MVSRVEMEGVKKRNYFGLDMFELTPQVPVKCTVAVSPTEKLVLEGNFAIDRHEGSWKFPEEVVITVFSRKAPWFERRAHNDGYNRVEIPIPRKVAAKLFELALHKLWLLPEGEQ